VATKDRVKDLEGHDNDVKELDRKRRKLNSSAPEQERGEKPAAQPRGTALDCNEENGELSSQYMLGQHREHLEQQPQGKESLERSIDTLDPTSGSQQSRRSQQQGQLILPGQTTKMPIQMMLCAGRAGPIAATVDTSSSSGRLALPLSQSQSCPPVSDSATTTTNRFTTPVTNVPEAHYEEKAAADVVRSVASAVTSHTTQTAPEATWMAVRTVALPSVAAPTPLFTPGSVVTTGTTEGSTATAEPVADTSVNRPAVRTLEAPLVAPTAPALAGVAAPTTAQESTLAAVSALETVPAPALRTGVTHTQTPEPVETQRKTPSVQFVGSIRLYYRQEERPNAMGSERPAVLGSNTGKSAARSLPVQSHWPASANP